MIPPDQYRYGSLKDWELQSKHRGIPERAYCVFAFVVLVVWPGWDVVGSAAGFR